MSNYDEFGTEASLDEYMEGLRKAIKEFEGEQ